MKKFLLLAVAAVIAGSASAQKISNVPQKMKSQQVEKIPAVKRVDGPMVAAKSPKFEVSQRPVVRKGVKHPSVSQKSFKSVAKNRLSAAPAKAIELKDSYTGIASNSEGGNELWKMLPATFTDEVGNEYAGLVNLVPNPFEAAGLEYTYVLYEEEDGELFIPAQYITTLSFTSGAKYEVFISNFSASSEDGSITLSFDENGKLTCEAPYVAFVLLPEGTTEFSFDAMVSYWTYYQNIKYVAEGEEEAPTPIFADNSALLFSTISADGYSFNIPHVMMPGYVPVQFKNYTLDPADTWSWKTATMEYNDILEEFIENEPIVGDTKDFEFTPVGGETYGPVSLKASFGDMESNEVSGMEEGALLYAGANGANWTFGDADGAPVISRANLNNELQGFVNAGSESGFHSLILYQGKPAAPLYFEGVNLMVYNFEKIADEVELKCKIQKIQRASNGRITMGEVIAEADLNQEDMVIGSWHNTAVLTWTDFYVVDELGMSETVDYLQIDDEFAIVLEGMDNDTFSGLLLCDGGTSNGLPTSYLIMSGAEEYTGYAFWSFYGHALVGFINPVYGYLYTEDETNLHFESTGGEATLHVQPMFYNGSDAEQQTAIWVAEDSEIPEWLELGIANEVYTSDAFGFDLVVKADALGTEEYREAEVVLEQWGAKLVLNVTQGTETGITATVKSVATGKQGTFNAAGQRVSNARGLVIENGKKIIRK